MHIDEAVLDQTVIDLKAKIDLAQGDLNDASKTLFSLMSIQKHGDKQIPDFVTGEVMSDIRRGEIYDTCKPKADAYLV